MMPQTVGPPTVGSVIERLPLRRVHIYIVIAAALGFAFDSFDTYIASYAMPAIIHEWKLDPISIGWLTSAGFWGMMTGAITWGPITDKFGRRPAFIATVLGFACLILLCYKVDSPSTYHCAVNDYS
jgi:MFS family permease